MSELENLKAFLGLPDGWLEVAEHYPPDRLDSRGYDWCGHDPLCTTLWEHLNKGWAVLRAIVEKAETERDQALQHVAAGQALADAAQGLFDAPHPNGNWHGLYAVYEGHGYMRCRLCSTVIVYDKDDIYDITSHQEGCPVPKLTEALANWNEG